MADTSKSERGAAARISKLLRAFRNDVKPLPRPKSLDQALAGKRVVITGASSGIGEAVAQHVARHGGTALLVARSRDKLEQVRAKIERSGGKAQLFVADLTVAADCERVIAELLKSGAVDVLVNNAGRSIRRSVRHSYNRAHDFERTMAINYFGSLRLILGLLPGMRERKQGHIINISSAGVLFRTPRFSAYIASKAALDTFSQIAAAESYGDRVYFTSVYMPLVRTPMIAPTNVYKRAPALTPDQAAELVLSALLSRKSSIMPFWGIAMLASHWLRPKSTLRVFNMLYRASPADAGAKKTIDATPASTQTLNAG